MKNIKTIFNSTFTVCCAVALIFMASCNNEDPSKEDTPELITRVTFTFTPAAGPPRILTATDPDGEGVSPLVIDGELSLDAQTTYTLTIDLINELADPTDPEYSITEELEEEADEHQFYFGWSVDNFFASPTGVGNLSDPTNPINYEDEDSNGLPLGLITTWTTGTVGSTTFTVVLKHQSIFKSEQVSSTTGETDMNIPFQVNVQ